MRDLALTPPGRHQTEHASLPFRQLDGGSSDPLPRFALRTFRPHVYGAIQNKTLNTQRGSGSIATRHGMTLPARASSMLLCMETRHSGSAMFSSSRACISASVGSLTPFPPLG